jgi:hypothetical protein
MVVVPLNLVSRSEAESYFGDGLVKRTWCGSGTLILLV